MKFWRVITSLILIFWVQVFPVQAQKNQTLIPEPLLQELVELVVENNPVLQSQRRLIKEIESLPFPSGTWDLNLTLSGGVTRDVLTGGGEIVPVGMVGLSFPLYSPSKKRELLQEKLTRKKELEEAKQKYIELKNSIVSDLLNKITKMSHLQNERKNLVRLKSYLEENIEVVREGVKTGAEKINVLWTLKERIMNLETKINNLSYEVEILKWKTAVTLGGERWQKLLGRLEKLR